MDRQARGYRPGIWLCSALIALQLAACTTTTMTTATVIVKVVPEVAPIVVTEALGAGQLAAFRKQHKEAGEVVMQDRVYTAYWVDDLQLDKLVLRPQDGGRTTEVVKVREVGRNRRIKLVDGKRNGKAFSSTEVLDE